MRFFKHDPDSPLSPRTNTTPAPPLAGKDSPLPDGGFFVTAIESAEEFKKYLNAAAQDLPPANDLQRLFVEELAISLWTQRRFSLIASEKLSIEIEQNYEKVRAAYPNADPSMHTVLANDRLQDCPGYRHALIEYDKAFRRTLSAYQKIRRHRKDR